MILQMIAHQRPTRLGIARRFGISALKSAGEQSLETEQTFTGKTFDHNTHLDLKTLKDANFQDFNSQEAEHSENQDHFDLRRQIRSKHLESHSELFEELKSKSYRRISKQNIQLTSQETTKTAISSHSFKNYERIEFVDNILVTEQVPNMQINNLIEQTIGVTTELDDSEFNPKSDIDFKDKGKGSIKIDFLYLEAYLSMPNYNTISLAEKRLTKLTSTIQNLSIRSNFFDLINHFRKMRTHSQIQTLIVSPNQRLNSGHWKLRRNLEPVREQLDHLLSLTLINGDFSISQEIMRLIDEFGFEMMTFAKTIFKSAPMGAKTKDYVGLAKTLEMAADMVRREGDYLNLLFQLLKQRTTSQKISQIASTLEGSKQIFRDLETMLTASPLERDLYEGVLNLGWVDPNESVDDLCKRFPDFERKFRRQVWFNLPKILDFDVDLNQIDDEELLLQLEFLHFLRERIGRSTVDDFKSIFTEETFLLNILINLDNCQDPKLALNAASSLDAFLRLKHYSSAKTKLLSELERGSNIRHSEYSLFLENLVRTFHAKGRLKDFVAEHLYLVHLFFSKPHVFSFEDDIRQHLITAIFELDLSGFVYQDQTMIIDLCFNSLDYSHLFQDKQIQALSEKIFVMLNLPCSKEFVEIAIMHAHSIASIFSDNPEVLRLLLRFISKSVPMDFFNRVNTNVFKKTSKMHTVFKLMEAIGLHDDISDFGLDPMRLMFDFDCLAKQRGLYNRDLENCFRNFRVMKQGCHESFTKEHFADLVGHAKGEYLIQKRMIEPEPLVNNRIHQIVCRELGGR